MNQERPFSYSATKTNQIKSKPAEISCGTDLGRGQDLAIPLPFLVKSLAPQFSPTVSFIVGIK